MKKILIGLALEMIDREGHIWTTYWDQAEEKEPIAKLALREVKAASKAYNWKLYHASMYWEKKVE